MISSFCSAPERIVVAIYAFALAFPFLMVTVAPPVSIWNVRNFSAAKHQLFQPASFDIAFASPCSYHVRTVSVFHLSRRNRSSALLSCRIIFLMVQVSHRLGLVVHCFRFDCGFRGVRGVDGGSNVDCFLGLRCDGQPTHSIPALARQEQLFQP